MGTAVSFDVRAARSGSAPEAAMDDAMAWLHDVDARFSTYRAESEISRIARGELDAAAASPDVRWILHRCARLREQTGGFFDARAGGRLDPSALVKGWAVQRAADGLRIAGVERFCINAGGDVVAAGPAWCVGIRHPLDAHAVAAVVEAEDLAVATSALYERGGHVLTPSGRPPEGVLSVTVTGPDLGIADAYATAALAMGSDGPAWTLRLDGYEAMTILADERVLTTPGFPA
jgi:thiamine biosynthesis lipoprotein